MTSISFCNVNNNTYETVCAWLHKPHVNAYLHGQGLENTLKDLQELISTGNNQWQHWIASTDGVLFGYLITSEIDPLADDAELFARHMKPNETAITLDLLIGEESYIGRGLAVPMIRTFLRDKFPNTSKVFIDPETTNTRAVHVYEKAGFEKLEEFIADWHPVNHWLMMLRMNKPVA